MNLLLLHTSFISLAIQFSNILLDPAHLWPGSPSFRAESRLRDHVLNSSICLFYRSGNKSLERLALSKSTKAKIIPVQFYSCTACGLLIINANHFLAHIIMIGHPQVLYFMEFILLQSICLHHHEIISVRKIQGQKHWELVWKAF